MKKIIKSLLMLLVLLSTNSVWANAKNTFELTTDSQKSADYHSYYFGTLPVYSRSYINYFVRNTGTTPLMFKQATIRGGQYSANHNCTGVLLPQTKCSFTIVFSPYFEGYHWGQFNLVFDQGSEIIVDVSGQAIR